MKKLIVSVLFLTLIVSCSSKPKKSTVAKPVVPDCVFPGSNTPAPGWICDEPVPGIELSAVGVAEHSAAGISYMKDIAALDGRGRLAEQIKVQVSKMVKQYLGTTGKGSAETVDAAASSTTKSVTSESLVGSKIYKTRVGPGKRLYALVGVDKNARASIVKQAVNTSMNNENALWQQFKSKQSFDEMAKDISAQKVQ